MIVFEPRAALTDVHDDDEMANLLRRRYEVLLRRAEAAAATAGAPAEGDYCTFSIDTEIARRAISAERQRLLALRADGTISGAAFQQVEQELDLEELDLQQLAPGADSVRGTDAVSAPHRS